MCRHNVDINVVVTLKHHQYIMGAHTHTHTQGKKLSVSQVAMLVMLYTAKINK